MDKEEWQRSFDKWYKICADLAELTEIKRPETRNAWLYNKRKVRDLAHYKYEFIYGSCSYCDEFNQDSGDPHDYPEGEDIAFIECGTCPLYEAGACASNSYRNSGFLFWLIDKALIDNRLSDAHGHAVKLLHIITNTKDEALEGYNGTPE